MVAEHRNIRADIYAILKEFAHRPEPFSRHTVAELWTDSHISARMLDLHLDAESDLASRRPALIDGMVDWLDRRLGLSGKSVTDLGCGPGLYARRMAERGARVTGIDFSARSLDHAAAAARKAGQAIDWIRGDYLDCDLPAGQDLICLIYGDICALSPDRRRALLARVRAALAPDGRFVCDSFSPFQYAARSPGLAFARNLMDGFWADGDYFGFQATFLYDDRSLVLDRYLIVEPGRRREIFNWLQYFDPHSLSAEVAAAGFAVDEIVDALTGDPWADSPREFAVVARAV